MHTVARSALVMHSAGDMYSLVNDVESYASFLPWCGGSRVLEHTGREMVAEVRIAFRGVSKSFTTRNRLQADEKITMTLLNGPFSELSGVWEFKPLRPDACRISLDLRFDFSSPAAGAVVGPVFRHIADSMVDSFVGRAAQIHAGPDGAQVAPDQAQAVPDEAEAVLDQAQAVPDETSQRPPATISVEVVYALPERQVVEEVQFHSSPHPATPTASTPITIEQAIRASSLPARFPEIRLGETPVGVFGAVRPLDWPLADRDRVEIYRSLRVSPSEARRRRAGIPCNPQSDEA